MRTKLALGAFALLALTVGAHAGEPAEMDLALTSRGLYEFNFRCEFDHRGSGLGGADARAYAQVFAWLKRGGEWSKDLEVDNSDYNKLAVIFHHELKYANGAKLISRERHVEISAHDGSPSIFVKRRHGDVVTQNWMRYEATLKLHGRPLRGFCLVRAEPANLN